MVVNKYTPTSNTRELPTKPIVVIQKSEESMLDELFKGMKELKLNLARLEEKRQPSWEKFETNKSKQRFIWA